MYLAEELCDSIYFSTKSGIYHGDLHSKNVLVSKNGDFRIIDFGTSLYLTKERSLKRHFDLIYKIMDEILYPFKPLQSYPRKISKTEKYDIEWMQDIYDVFFEQIEKMIVYIAFFTNSENWLPWGISYYKEIPDLYNEETKLIKNIISKGLLGINNETLGSNWLWWPDQKWSIK